MTSIGSMEHPELALGHDSGFRFGDTRLVSDFVDQCSGLSGGTLFFTAPFYDVDFLEGLRNRFSNPRMRFEVVVRNADTAEDLGKRLSRNGCRPAVVHICNRLHAKVYIFESLQRELSVVVGS